MHERATEELEEFFRVAITRLCSSIDSKRGCKEVLGIGFVTDDSVTAIAAFYLLDGDLPKNAEAFLRLSPVEWHRSDDASFSSLNNYLATNHPPVSESESEYLARVVLVFDACARALDKLDIRRRYGPMLYITFAGVDPNPPLIDSERDFVARLNSSECFNEWSRELG